ncbi:MAG: hypothetical protein ACYDBH_00880 [Acidobacteriaceae bacterium]
MSRFRAPHYVVDIADRLIGDLGHGRKTALANAAGVKKQALTWWRYAGVPVHRASAVADFLGITLADVRPDIFSPEKPDNKHGKDS